MSKIRKHVVMMLEAGLLSIPIGIGGEMASSGMGGTTYVLAYGFILIMKALARGLDMEAKENNDD